MGGAVSKAPQCKACTTRLQRPSFPYLFITAAVLPLLWFQCQNSPKLSIRWKIDRLRPDNRIIQAEQFYKEDDRKWALYAWNNTSLKDLTTDESRESYRLLKTWLFSETLKVENLDLAEMQVAAMYLDFDDLWLGTWNGGIYRLSLSSGEHYALAKDTPSLVPKVVYRIRKSGNAFWFAMYQGLRFYNYHTGSSGWLQMPGVTGAVSDFLESSEGLFVASLTHGAWQRTASGDIFPLSIAGSSDGLSVATPVAALEYQENLGLILGSVGKGALRWKNGVMESLENIEPIFSLLKNVNHIVDDGTSLWFASSGEGLFRWDYRNNRAYQISAEDSLLRSNRISALLYSSDWIFVGDEQGGLVGYHLPDQKWYMWDSGRRLEFGSISSLAYRNGQLFYSTLAGGVRQIHWLKYLFALKEKDGNF